MKKIEGQSHMILQIFVGNVFLPSLNKAFLVEGVIYNIMSISQLSDNDYEVFFNQKSYKTISQKMALLSLVDQK